MYNLYRTIQEFVDIVKKYEECRVHVESDMKVVLYYDENFALMVDKGVISYAEHILIIEDSLVKALEHIAAEQRDLLPKNTHVFDGPKKNPEYVGPCLCEEIHLSAPKLCSLDMNGIVVSAFPGTGKSYFTKLYPDICSDSDSSKYSHNADGTKNENFILEYMQHIKDAKANNTVVFVSSHEEVRKALINEGIFFVLVYPSRDLKLEYVNRYKKRGSTDEFIDMLYSKWDSFIDSCEQTRDCRHIVLGPGAYIKDLDIFNMPRSSGSVYTPAANANMTTK